MVPVVPYRVRTTPWGSYAQPAASRDNLRRYLQQQSTSLWKQASIGGEQSEGFEQAFAALAYAYLKDKSPRLLDFIVGFQLVDRNEDNTKAIGIFGFKIGDQWFYAPVFFLNGDLKGHELLYIKSQDTFVPMKENWVNYLISRKPLVLGEPTEQNATQLGGLLPDLARFRNPPSMYKFSSAAPVVQPWAVGILPVMAALAQIEPAAWVKQAEAARRLDLRQALADSPLLLVAFEQYYQRYPLIKRGFDQFYGPDFFWQMGQRLHARVKQAAQYILSPEDDNVPAELRELTTKYRRRKKKPDEPPAPPGHNKSAKLHIVIRETISSVGGPEAAQKIQGLIDSFIDDVISLPKVESTNRKLREDLAKPQRVIIHDDRSDEEVSVAYYPQHGLRFTNPTQTGLYSVLEKPGGLAKMVVLMHPQSSDGRHTFATVLRQDSPADWLNTHPTNVWVEECDCPNGEEWRRWVRSFPGVESIQVGGTYVLVHENGSATAPFQVKQELADDSFIVYWMDFCEFAKERPRALPPLERPFYPDWSSPAQPNRLVINPRPGSNLRSSQGELFVPNTYHAVALSEPAARLGPFMLSACGCGSISSGKRPIQPGNLMHLDRMLRQSSSLQVQSLGANHYRVKDRDRQQTMEKDACLVHLVRDHGLREKQAREILQQADQKRSSGQPARFLVKYAFGYGGLQPPPSGPPIPDPMMTSIPAGLSGMIPAMPSQEIGVPVDSLSSQLTDPRIYDPLYQPDTQAIQLAQRASQSGQKEIFDTAMIAGMLKSVRQDSLVDRYLGDLMKALDRLGRILFMFYWHQEEFEDRYGKTDLPELEDSIRNAFEVLGDLCLFLKEKTVHGGLDLALAGVGGKNVSPSVEDASKI